MAGRIRAAATGFTLVELLVSMVVSLILVVALLQMFNAATDTWQRGEAQSDAFREARGALQLMARDLSSTLQASYAQPPQIPGSTSVVAPPLLPTLVLNRYPVFDSTQTSDPNQQNNEEVYCLTTISSPTVASTASSTPSSTPASLAAARELCAVGYFCQWLPSVPPYSANAARAPHAYGLMRQYVNGDGTFLRFKKAQQSYPAGTALGFLDIYKRAAVSLIPSSSVPMDTDGATPLAQSVELAAYVWDLKVRISTNLVTTDTKYDNGESTPPSATDPATTTPYDYSAYPGPPTQPLPPDLPPYVEIRFKALSANAGRRLEGNGSVTPADWLPSATTNVHRTLIVPNAQQFVLRVPLTNGSAQLPTPTPSS